MKSHNHQTLEFFLSSYRLDDIVQRNVLVTKDFTFTTPVVGALNFKQFHNYNLVLRNHSEHRVLKITTKDDFNFTAMVENTIVESASNYEKKIVSKLEIIFIDHLINSIVVNYNASAHDTRIFNKILQPFTKP